MASLSQACRLLRSSQLRKYVVIRAASFSSSVPNAVAQNFTMPAMSPTMTEGNIASWKVKEGDKFRAGDVLLEIETDKANIDVEATDDGVMAKIFMDSGTKGIKVGDRIAVIAEVDDDLSTLEMPPEPKAKSSASTSTPTPDPAIAPSQPQASPTSKHQYPPSKNPQSPSPSVMNLLKRNKLSADDIPNIPATGPRGRLLKGDVLAYVGSISKEGPAGVGAIVDKLAHLDLSNIKVRQAAPAKAAATTEKKTAPATAVPVPAVAGGKGKDVKKAAAAAAAPPKPVLSTEIELNIDVSLERLGRFQRDVQAHLGFSPATTLFVTQASLAANTSLPPSKVPPSPDDIFNDILGVKSQRAQKSYTPQLLSVPRQSVAPSAKAAQAKSLDAIYDILTGAKPKAPLGKKPVTTVSTLVVKVRREDETRGRVFLERVKRALEEEPEKLLGDWTAGAGLVGVKAGGVKHLM